MQAGIRRRASAWPSLVFGLTPAAWMAFLLVVLTFGLSDTISTFVAFHISQGKEANPLGAYALQFGLLGLVLLKALGLTGAYILSRFVVSVGSRLWRRVLIASLLAIAAIYVVVTISNLMTVFAGADLYHYFAS